VAILVEVENRRKWTEQKIDAEVYGFLFEQDFVPVLADLQKSWQYNVVLLKKELLSRPPITRAILNFIASAPTEAG
jgi:hypothetical protein